MGGRNKASSLKFYQTLFSESPIGMAIYDSNGQCIIANDALVFIIGGSKEHVISSNYHKIESWKTSGLYDAVVKAVDSNIMITKDVTLTSIFGKLFSVNANLQPISIDDDNYLLLTYTDLSETIKLQYNLKKSQEFNETILNTSPDVIYIYDLIEKKNIYSNEKIKDILGFTEIELIDMGTALIQNLMHPDDYRIYIKETIPRYNSAKDKDLIVHSYRMKNKTGEWRRLLSKELIFSRNEDGTPEQIFGMISDITDKTLAEEIKKESQIALQKSEKRYRKLFENMLVAFALHEIILDKNGKPVDYIFLECNNAFAAMTGLEGKKIIGKKVTEVLPGIENDPADWIALYGNLALTGKTLNFEQFSDSLHRWYSVIAYSPVKMQFATMFQDITEQKQLESNMNQNHKMQAIGQLAGGVAHDFNNQLTGIAGYTEILREELADNEELLGYINKIVLAVKRSSDLTAQLLAFARKGKYLSIKVNIHNIIEEVISFLQHTINKSISIKQDLYTGNLYILGDPSQIQNALMNLALNARDAIKDTGEIVISTTLVMLDEEYCRTVPYKINAGEYVRISVIDNGCGMSNSVISRIFEPFYTTKEQGKGTGMGLAAVYGTVKNHDGSISVKSEIDHGTTFNLYFPNLEVKNRRKEESELKLDSVKGKANILLVDDEPMIINTYTFMLKKLGYSIIARSNGAQAVEYYKKNWEKIDLVIMDMVMPKMGGGEAFRKMKEINNKVLVLLASGYSLDGEAQKIINEGATGFIQKPFRIAELSLKIAEFLSLH